jgi:hypothetical protein
MKAIYGRGLLKGGECSDVKKEGMCTPSVRGRWAGGSQCRSPWAVAGSPAVDASGKRNDLPRFVPHAFRFNTLFDSISSLPSPFPSVTLSGRRPL